MNMSLNKLFILIITLSFGSLCQGESLFQGKLGPIKYNVENLPKYLKAEIRNSVRKESKKLFTGDKDHVFRLDYKVTQVDQDKVYPNSGGTVGLLYARWRVTLTFSKYKPSKSIIGVTTFEIYSTHQTDSMSVPSKSDDPKHSLPELLSKRIPIALEEISGKNISFSLGQLERRMAKIQTTGVSTRAFSNLGVGLKKTGKAVGSALEFLSDPAIAGAINSKIQSAGAELNSMQQENFRRGLEIQSMVMESRNDSPYEIKQTLSSTLASPDSVYVKRFDNHNSKRNSQNTYNQMQENCEKQNGILSNGNCFKKTGQTDNTYVVDQSVQHEKKLSSASNSSGRNVVKDTKPERHFGRDMPIEWTLDDIKKRGVFFVETHSEENAVSDIKTYLRNKAKKECEKSDWDSVTLTNWSARNCKEVNRMGSKFWHCQGSGMYQCMNN